MTDIDTSTWKEFKISDLFEIKKVKGKTIKEYESGSIPYVSGTSSNNGVINKVSSLGNDISEGNCLTVDPITGFTAYQEEDFIGRGFSGASIVALYNENLTRENAEFFCAVIYKKIHESASYSNLYNTKRLADVTILLPAKEEYVPDFDYMESYIKEIEKESITRMKKERERKIEAGRKAIGTKKIYAGNDEISEDVEWGEFEIKDICQLLRGKEKAPKKVENGKYNLISETNYNNGIIKKGKSEFVFKAPAITVSVNNATSVFYQIHDFCASVNILILKAKWMEIYPNVALFICSALAKYNSRFDYNAKTSKDRLLESKIQLPVDRATGKPDWKYMENYISILQKNNLIRYSKDSRKNILTAEKIIASNRLCRASQNRDAFLFVILLLIGWLKG